MRPKTNTSRLSPARATKNLELPEVVNNRSRLQTRRCRMQKPERRKRHRQRREDRRLVTASGDQTGSCRRKRKRKCGRDVMSGKECRTFEQTALAAEVRLSGRTMSIQHICDTEGIKVNRNENYNTQSYEP